VVAARHFDGVRFRVAATALRRQQDRLRILPRRESQVDIGDDGGQLPQIIERVRAENVGNIVTFSSRSPKEKDLASRLSP
jgi:hypothetical protein